MALAGLLLGRWEFFDVEFAFAAKVDDFFAGEECPVGDGSGGSGFLEELWIADVVGLDFADDCYQAGGGEVFGYVGGRSGELFDVGFAVGEVVGGGAAGQVYEVGLDVYCGEGFDDLGEVRWPASEAARVSRMTVVFMVRLLIRWGFCRGCWLERVS